MNESDFLKYKLRGDAFGWPKQLVSWMPSALMGDSLRIASAIYEIKMLMMGLFKIIQVKISNLTRKSTKYDIDGFQSNVTEVFVQLEEQKSHAHPGWFGRAKSLSRDEKAVN